MFGSLQRKVAKQAVLRTTRMLHRSITISVWMVAMSTIAATLGVKGLEEEVVAPCSICRGGHIVGTPDKAISLPGAPEEFTCEKLDDFLPSLYPESTHPDCQAIQQIGAICGCPTPFDSCTLCKNDAPMGFPDRPVEFFADAFPGEGSSPDCAIVDAFLRTSFIHSDTMCSSAQTFLGNYCECLGSITATLDSIEPCTLCEDGSSITLPDESISIGEFPFSTCKQLDAAVTALFKVDSDECSMFQSLSSMCGCPRKPHTCTMCPHGGTVAYPDKPARFLKDMFGGIEPSCKVFEAYAHSLDAKSDECQLVQSSGGFCGCAPIDDPCDVCDHGKQLTPEYEEVEVNHHLLALVGLSDTPFPITCEFGVSLQFQISKDDTICLAMQDRQDVCGCGEFVHYGAYTENMRATLFWLPFASGFLSLIGSLAIIVDVARNKERRKQMYNQLVASMSIFDALSSIAWMFSSSSNPVDDAWPIYGEGGNDATCTAQAFFLQLALTSILYNASLTSYYFMSVVLGWRGMKLKSKACYLHAVPVFVGVSLALAGIPFYDTVLGVCHIPAPPLSRSWGPITWLQLFPVFTAIGFCTVLIFCVWLKVHRQVAAASRRNFQVARLNLVAALSTRQGSTHSPNTTGLTRRSSLRGREERVPLSTLQRVERTVMWQALFYVFALYLCWICQLVLLKTTQKRRMSYSFHVAILFLIPLQGFLNALNYYRPRLARFFREHQRRKLEVSGGGISPPDSEGSRPQSELTEERHRRSEESLHSHEEQSDSAIFDNIMEPSAYLEQAFAPDSTEECYLERKDDLHFRDGPPTCLSMGPIEEIPEEDV